MGSDFEAFRVWFKMISLRSESILNLHRHKKNLTNYKLKETDLINLQIKLILKQGPKYKGKGINLI